MIKIDLITGFLGAGKTTFLKKYAAWLMSRGQSIGILENDLGAVNVDMMLLKSLEGENCELEMISGGCDREASVEEKKILSTHSLMLENRQNGRITGVKDIKSFDEKEILLFTQAGKLVIKGEQLHVKQLDLEKGEVDLEGKVDSLTYLSKNTDNRDESLFRRMFR